MTGLEKEETPAPAPAPAPVPAAPPPVVAIPAPAPMPMPEPTPLQPVAVAAAPAPEPPPVATAKETIIPPAGVVNAGQTPSGTVYDRLDRGEKLTAKEINAAWDDPESGLQARLLKAGR